MFLIIAGTACSRLPGLTPDTLADAQQKWNAHKPASYHLVIEMSGDRVEQGRFEELLSRGGAFAAMARRQGMGADLADAIAR